MSRRRREVARGRPAVAPRSPRGRRSRQLQARLRPPGGGCGLDAKLAATRSLAWMWRSGSHLQQEICGFRAGSLTDALAPAPWATGRLLFTPPSLLRSGRKTLPGAKVGELLWKAAALSSVANEDERVAAFGGGRSAVKTEAECQTRPRAKEGNERRSSYLLPLSVLP